MVSTATAPWLSRSNRVICTFVSDFQRIEIRTNFTGLKPVVETIAAPP